jgi:hypothetical protein
MELADIFAPLDDVDRNLYDSAIEEIATELGSPSPDKLSRTIAADTQQDISGATLRRWIADRDIPNRYVVYLCQKVGRPDLVRSLLPELREFLS